MCGDFNAHHYSWDTSAQETPRGKVVQDWFEESLTAPLNNGNPTTSSRFEQGLTSFSAPDVSMTAASSLQRFSWETLQELNSDHLPILLKWTGKHQRDKPTRFTWPNFRKANWELYRELLSAKAPAIEAVSEASAKLTAVLAAMEEARKRQ